MQGRLLTETLVTPAFLHYFLIPQLCREDECFQLKDEQKCEQKLLFTESHGALTQNKQIGI